MALKDLVSDLSNFKGQSQYDGLDSQIEKGVDFFPNNSAGANGFTPKTNLESKYNKFMKDVRENNSLPNQYESQANILAPKVQPKFTDDFMTTPLASYVSMFNPPTNDSLTLTVAKKDGSGNWTFNDTQQIPSATTTDFMSRVNFQSRYSDFVSGISSQTFNVGRVLHTVDNPLATQNANYVSIKNEGPFTLSDFSVPPTQKTYDDSDYIKQLFEFKNDTFQNVPNGMNILNKFGTSNFRRVANKGPFDGNDTHPIILRDVNSNWDNYINEKLIGGTPGNALSGALGFVGLLTRTSRDLADKVRIFKFLTSPKGGLFIAKQAGLQLLNPTLETRIYNPFSTIGIAGVGDLLQMNVNGLTEMAKSFVFPTHIQRHSNVISALIESDRYEPIVLGTNNGDGRLSYQSQAFSNDFIPDIDLPQIPKVKTKSESLNNVLNFFVGKANKKINKVEKKINKIIDSTEAAASIILSNPNRYSGLISSAPISITNGIPNFYVGKDILKTDVNKVLQKPGGTFNDKTANIVTDKDIVTHATLNYSQLKEDFSYTENELLTPNDINSNEGFGFEDMEKRTAARKINRDIGFQKNRNGDADKINMLPYGLNYNQTEDADLKDFIKFRFKDVVNNKFLVFRAILEGITDTVTPDYAEDRYIGRPDTLFVYQGVNRSISFTFSIYPKTKQELPILMDKLNYLVGLCYPSYTEGERMISPFIELTMGDMFVDTPGILSGLTISVEEQSTWEIDDKLQFPHFIKAACEFRHIGKHVPATTGKHYDLDRKLVESTVGQQSRTPTEVAKSPFEEVVDRLISNPLTNQQSSVN